MSEGWADVLAGEVLRAAPRLLGAEIVSDVGGARVAVRLVEVEAYSGVGDDPGSHAHRGRTRRNETMFGPSGHGYVYFTYGMHWCLNVVCGPEGVASGVLLRAAEVVDGAAVARARRGGAQDRDLARGPARLAQALAVTGDLDGVDLLAEVSPVRLGAVPPTIGAEMRCGPRVGVAGAGAATPWRFWLADEPTVSTYRPAQPRRRPRPGSGSLAP